MRVAYTGGGTAGHILPNIAVHEELKQTLGKKQQPLEAFYIGSKKGPERGLAERYNIPFHAISTGKVRRYFSLANFIDPFRIVAGVFQASRLLKKLKPDVVMSKGGFVSVPVALAAWILKIPVVLHESDVSPGLANRVAKRFAKVVCISWAESRRYFPNSRTALTGIPVRREITQGVKQEGLKFLGFDGSKPVLAVMGGSLGAQFLNDAICELLPQLLKAYDIVHITGKGKTGAVECRRKTCGAGPEDCKCKSGAKCEGDDAPIAEKPFGQYRPFEYLHDDLANVYAASDLVLGRAGAGALADFGVLGLPSVLVPLGRKSSRGDQILNAEQFRLSGASIVHFQETLQEGPSGLKKLAKTLLRLAHDEKKLASMSRGAKEFGKQCSSAASVIADILVSTAGGK